MSQPWWKTRAIYQIYPRSFLDTTGNGIGDLVGIAEGLDQIKELGAGIVWISPIFVSPMADNGYDVADYKAIDPLFGTTENFDALIAKAKSLDLKIVLDIALNHTSTAHPWFQAAVNDPTGPFRDYYHWRDTPNNWRSIFGGPAWSKLEGDDQYYLHLFDKTQADLNWENPAVRNAIYDALRFWLDRGVDGYRLDVVTVISKPKGLPDAPDPRPIPLYDMLASGPRLHEWLRDMHQEVFSKYDCVAIGEGPGLTTARSAQLVDASDPMLNMIYHFDFVDGHDNSETEDWDRVWFKSVMSKWDRGIGDDGWNSCVLGNHDLRRLVSRFGSRQGHEALSAKALGAVTLLQRATPFIYQGDELGMADAHFTALNQLNDVWAHKTYELARAKGLDHDTAFQKAATMTRDHARTPYNWTPKGGFSTGTAWLPHAGAENGANLESQRQDPNSIRSFYQTLLTLRQKDPETWVFGAYKDLLPEHAALYMFTRGETGFVIINLSDDRVVLPDEVFAHLSERQQLASSGTLEGRELGAWAVRICQ
jgi:oligo-1,6-glucosidase